MPDPQATTEVSSCPATASVVQPVWRYGPGGDWAQADDELAGEGPLEIRVRGRAVCVAMRTPPMRDEPGLPVHSADSDEPPACASTDHELAAGFLLSEGVIRAAEDIDRIAPCTRAAERNVINVFLAPHIEFDPSRLTRHVFASSSCGICGKASIDAILADFDPLTRPPHRDAPPMMAADTLASLPDMLRDQQPGFSRTGGLHAAGVFDANGELIAAREDIGRHNAVDKVLGYLLMQGQLPLAGHVLMVSGRVSFEIVQKALAARVPIVAAVSAPSSLAVEFARDSGQTLAGFVRDGRFNLYAHSQRIGPPS